MPLQLTLKKNLDLPIEVDAITPDKLLGQSETTIAAQEVWCGKSKATLNDFFDIQGTVTGADPVVHWQGDMSRVYGLGQSMKSGRMVIHSHVGRHAGFQMTGGRLEVLGNAGHYLGAEMTGGTIVVTGNAGNHVGGTFNGAKFGMNRGEIFINGSAGKGTGQGMRRGTIVVGQAMGDLAGWNMLAGTIICLGKCGLHPGAGMKRGTIVGTTDPIVSQQLLDDQALLPTFKAGADYTVPIFQILKIWLAQQSVQGRSVFESSQLAKLSGPYQVYHGDQLQGGRGELFLASTKI